MKYICSKVKEGRCDIFGCKHHYEHSHTSTCDNGECSRHKDEIYCRVPCVPVNEFLKEDEFKM